MGNPSRFGTLFNIHVGTLGWVYDRAGAGRKVHGTKKPCVRDFF